MSRAGDALNTITGVLDEQDFPMGDDLRKTLSKTQISAKVALETALKHLKALEKAIGSLDKKHPVHKEIKAVMKQYKTLYAGIAKIAVVVDRHDPEGV